MRRAAGHFAALATVGVLFAFVGPPVASRAQSAQVERIDIYDAGIYCAETVQKVPDPSAPGGFRNVVRNMRLLRRTDQIPAQIGVRFGMKYTVVGTPKNTFAEMRLVTRLPPPGLHEPSGRVMTSNEYVYDISIGTDGYREYFLEYDWELLQGPWVFEMWINGRKFAEQVFTLAKPPSRTPLPCAPVVSSLSP